MAPILVDRSGAVATITLNRPEVLNALDREMALALTPVIDELSADEAVRCVVMKGGGSRFHGRRRRRLLQAKTSTTSPT